MSISGCELPFSQSVRNLGFYLDETLSMDAYIKNLCRILFCQLRRIGKIRSLLSTDAANKLTVSLILSRLDYCNSLLAGIPDNKLNTLQRIQNHTARLALRKSRRASVSGLLRAHHWLPLKAMVVVVFEYVDTVYGFFMGILFMLSWMFQNNYLDTCCFECLICMCFVFL